MDLRDPLLRDVLSRAAAAGRRVRRAALAGLDRALSWGDPWEAFGRAEAVLADAAAGLAAVEARARLAASLAGARGLAAGLPASFVADAGPASPPPPPWTLEAMARVMDTLTPAQQADYLSALPPAAALELEALAGPPDVDEVLAAAGGEQLPLVERAVAALKGKGLADFPLLRSLDESAVGRAEASGRRLRAGATDRLRDLLAESVGGGEGLAGFRRRVREEAGGGALLSEGSVEAAFRTGVQEAYSAGLDSLLEDPLVGGHFPYEETLPVRDSRLSSLCSEVSRSGIQGTAVFRRDDPVWLKLKPPRHVNCRCGRNPLTIDEAARRGVREAVRWRETGTPPERPAWVPMPDLPRR